MRSSYSGQLGELLLDGGSWRLYRNGIESRGKAIPWQNVEEIYISGSVSTVEHFVPAGEKRSIEIVDSYKNKVKITLSGFFHMSETKRREYADIYTFILQNISDRQLTQFLQRLADGKQISFGLLDVSSNGFYYNKIFGRELIEVSSIRGYDISNGEFYLQYLKDNKERAEKNLHSVENIPNIHILQHFIREISEQNVKE